MSNILANTPAESEKIKALLQKKLPLHRKAYSDRTAWLMACFSELAYIRSEEKEKLLAELTTLKVDLCKTFDKNGTQAILVSNAQYIVLAFRGTEATSLKDIKADLGAKTMPSESGGKIHSGFKEAYGQVGHAVQQTLKQEEFKDKSLFIAGHSLGGALATIAAKELTHAGGIAACYTFGSPRVGSVVWTSSMKTPVYRVVNAADGVTMLPFGGSAIGIFRWFVGFLPYIGAMFRSWLSQFANYAHAGDMRYLTNCRKGKYTEVKLLYSVNLFYRLFGLFHAKRPLSGFLADHSISIYRRKLMLIAERRNKV